MAGNSKTVDRKLGLTLLTISLITYFILTRYLQFTQDDAWITFRYATNFINGHGLVYNIGAQIEGYTNFLWTLIIIIGAQIGLKMPILAHWLGVSIGGMVIIMTYRIACDRFEASGITRPCFGAGVASLMLGVCYSFSYWVGAGLETALFSLLILSSYYCFMKRSLLVIPALVAATLTRPEGFLIFLILVALEFFGRRDRYRQLLVIVLGYSLFILPFVIFKFIYYQSLLPNTFYAKTGFSLEQLQYGWSYAVTYFGHYWGYGLFLLPSLIVFYRRPNQLGSIAVILFLYLFYILLVGGDVLKVHRFFIPIMPFLIIFFTYGVFQLSNRLVIVIPSLLLVFIWQLYMPLNYVQTYLHNERGLATKIDNVIDRLKQSDHSNFSIAISTIGLAGYKLIDHDVIDMLGLTDSTIARHPEPPIENLTSSWRESKYNSHYLLSRQPDYIMFSTGFKPSAPAERALFLYTKFLDNYRTISFHYGTHLHPIFKRYFEIKEPIERDVSVEMVQNLNAGINLLWNQKDYPAALDSFKKALSFSPSPPIGYPYIRHYMSIAYLFDGDFESSYKSLQMIVQFDSLVFDAYKDLYRYEYSLGNFEQAQIYRSHSARLAPWYIPRLDSLLLRQTP